MPKVNAFGELVNDSQASNIYDIIAKPSYTVSDKSDKLAQRAADKAARLNPTSANNLTAAQLQQLLSDTIDAQVYTRDDGSQYTIDYMLDSNGMSQGSREVPYSDINRYGTPDTRNLYIDDTKEGNYKLGLARSDKGFIGRYTPGSDGYGWTPGDRGVTVDDGALLDITLPRALADKFENTVHSNTGQILNRVGGLTEQELSASGLGSGKSEYTTPNAPMWSGKDYKGELPADTYMPKTLSGFNSSQEEYLAGLINGNSKEPSGYFGNLVNGVQGALGTSAAKVGDLAGDFIIRSAKEIAQQVGGVTEEQANARIEKAAKEYGLENLVNNKGNFIALDKYKEMSEYGYDDSRIKAYGTEFKQVIGDPNASALRKLWTMAKGIQHFPEVLATSAGEMALAALPGGMAVLAASTTNDFLEERVAIKGTSDLTAEDYAIAGTMGTVYAAVNQFTKGMAGLKPTSKVVKEMVNGLSATGAKEVIAKMSGMLANGAFKGFEEGVEEIIQGSAEVVATKYATSKENEILTKDTALDLALQGTLGMGAGIGSSVAGDTVSALSDKSLRTKLNEKIAGFKDTDIEDDTVDTPAAPTHGPITSSIKDAKDFETAAQSFDATFKALQQEADETGKSFKETFMSKPAEYQDDFIAANNLIKTMNHQSMMSTGKGNSTVLGASSEEEFAIINAYVSANTEEEAEAYANLLQSEGYFKDDPDIPNIIERAKEVRTAYQGLTELERTREDITTKGLTADLKGYISYYTDALANPVGSTTRDDNIGRLAKFTSSQYNKQTALTTGRDEVVTELATTIDKMSKKYNLSTKTVTLAMTYANGFYNGTTEETKKAAKAAFSAAKTKGMNFDTELSLKGKKSAVKYASEYFNKKQAGFTTKDGEFDVTGTQALRDYAEEEGLDISTFSEQWQKPSNITTTINAIEEEVNAMTKALDALTGDTLHTSPKAQKGTQEARSPEEGTTSPVETSEASTSSESKPKVTSVDPKILAEATKLAKANNPNLDEDSIAFTSAVNDAVEYLNKEKSAAGKAKLEEDTTTDRFTDAQLKNMAAQLKKYPTGFKINSPKYASTLVNDPRVTYSDGVVTAVDLTGIETESDTSPESQKPTQKAPKESKGKSTKAKVIEASESAVSFKDLVNELISAKDPKRLTAIKRDILTRLNGGTLTDEQKAKLEAKLNGILTNKDTLLQDIESIFGEMDTISGFIDDTTSMVEELNSLKEARDVLGTQWDSVVSEVKDARKKLVDLIRVYNSKDSRKGYGEGAPKIDMEITESGNYGSVLKALNNYITDLEADKGRFTKAKLAIAEALQKLLNAVYKAKTAYNKAMKNKAAFQEKQSALNEQITALENIIHKRASIVKTKIDKASDKLSGVAGLKKWLENKYHTKSSEQATTGKVKAEKYTPFSLKNVLKVSNPTSSFLNAVGTKEEVDGIFTEEGGIDAFRANLGLIRDITKMEFIEYPYYQLLVSPDGQFNNNVAMAAKAAVDKYIAENAEMLTQLSPKDLQIVYGKTKDNWMETSESALNGGVPATMIVSSIAKDIGDMLGIKPNKYTRPNGEIIDYTELHEKILGGLAYATLQHMEHVGIIKEHEVRLEEDTQVVIYTYKLDEAYQTKEAKSALKDKVTATEKAYGIVKSKIPVYTSPRKSTKDSIRKRKESLTEVSDTVARAIINNESVKWTPSIDAINDLLALNPDVLRTLLGRADANNPDLTKEQQVSIDGKNRQIDADIENLKILKEMIDNGEVVDGVYFRWFVSKSGREMIDAKGGLNPQSIKLHRYLVTTDAQRGVVDADKDPMSLTMFKLGVAQALGYSVDKNPIADSEAFADAILKDDKTLNELYTNIKAGNTKFTINGEDVEIKEVAHTMTALVEGRKYVAAKGKPFETSMTVEVDGLTNGFAHKMMQFLATDISEGTEINDKTVEWLNKIGLSFDKDTAIDMVDKIKKGADGGIVDAYITLGENLVPEDKDIITSLEERMSKQYSNGKLSNYHADKRIENFGTAKESEIVAKAKALVNIMPKMRENGKLQKFVRTLMKDPFMTFGYSAGFKSMSNGVAAQLIDDTMSKILNEDSADVDAILEALGVNPRAKEAFRNELRTKTYNNIILDNGKSLLTAYRGLIMGVYGDAIQEVVEAEFGGLTSINTAIVGTTNTIFDMFKVAYDMELKAKGITGAPSNEVHEEIMTKLKKAGMLPVIKGPDSKGYEDGIALYGTKSEVAASNKYADARTYAARPWGGRTVKAQRKGYVNPKASGGVIPTHYTDGLGTALTTLRHDVLQIFDAYVLGVNQASVVGEMNKDFAEISMNPDWSQTKAAAEGLENIINNAKKYFGKDYDTYFKTVMNVQLKNLATRLNKTVDKVTEKYQNPNLMLANMQALDAATQSRRQDLARKWFTVEQFVLNNDSAFEYNGEKVLNTKLRDAITKANPNANVDKIMSKVAKNVAAIFSECE